MSRKEQSELEDKVWSLELELKKSIAFIDSQEDTIWELEQDLQEANEKIDLLEMRLSNKWEDGE